MSEHAEAGNEVKQEEAAVEQLVSICVHHAHNLAEIKARTGQPLCSWSIDQVRNDVLDALKSLFKKAA